MVLFRFSATIALVVCSLLGPTLAVPLVEKLRSLTPEARDVLRGSTPRFVVYSDAWVSPLPKPSEIKGYNVFALSFWLTSGATDMAKQWEDLSGSQRSEYLKEYNDAGISLIASAFGETDAPTSGNHDPIVTADRLASWVLQHSLQGVDIDYEDFGAFDNNAGAAEQWLISLTRQLRTHLPQGQYVLSHAPVAPWFTPNRWSGGGYLGVHRQVGHLIDWYNVQFYNQGTTEYTTCHGLITASSSQWPESAVFQIAANGVDLNKLVIGKPARRADATNGYMDLGKLAWCVSVAHKRGWSAGVMVFEYPYAPSWWITTVRGNTF